MRGLALEEFGNTSLSHLREDHRLTTYSVFCYREVDEQEEDMGHQFQGLAPRTE